MLTIASRQGLVQTRNGTYAVGYGVVLSFFSPGHNDGRVDLERDTHDLLAQLQANNQNMRVESDACRIRVGGQNGLSVLLSSDSPLSDCPEMDLLVTSARPEGLFYSVFIAPRPEFEQTRDTFDQMIRSIRFANQ